MGFDLFDQEDPRDWGSEKRHEEWEQFRSSEVVGPHCRSCQYDPEPVIFRGRLEAPLMVVGDYTAPADQKTNAPFSGPAGTLLRKMLAAIDLDWEFDCYITNALLCDGTEDPPRTKSVRACRTNLYRQIDIVNPEVILAVGAQALQSLYDVPTSETMSDYLGHRGPVPDYPWIEGVVTYNPAYLLRLQQHPERYRSVKRLVWEHLQTTRDLLEAA